MPEITHHLTLRESVLFTGFAIWSKRSDKDIQKENKKILASKALQMPEAVVNVVRTVYLEKTHSLREFKKINEIACIEFRKWMVEQKTKLKRDPLPLAKVEVSKVRFNEAFICS